MNVAAQHRTVPISVIICTRNRPDDIQRCLDSLTRVNYPQWNIFIVDQSDDDVTRTVVEYFQHRLPRVHYYAMYDKGLSRARNKGVEMADGEIVAFLDDDCTVEADWLRQVVGAFDRYPRAALVFGAVLAAPHDASKYSVPIHKAPEEVVLRGRLDRLRALGMGASMYVRRSAVRRVGIFDVHLGAGSGVFECTEESDFVYRCMELGCSVVETPHISVTHYGLREYAGGTMARLLRSYPYSEGSFHMKLLRAGDVTIFPLMVTELGHYLGQVRPLNALRGRPTHAMWASRYVYGIVASFKFNVDRRRRLFVTKGRWTSGTRS